MTKSEDFFCCNPVGLMMPSLFTRQSLKPCGVFFVCTLSALNVLLAQPAVVIVYDVQFL
jgi:hypothetical protein